MKSNRNAQADGLKQTEKGTIVKEVGFAFHFQKTSICSRFSPAKEKRVNEHASADHDNEHVAEGARRLHFYMQAPPHSYPDS